MIEKLYLEKAAHASTLERVSESPRAESAETEALRRELAEEREAATKARGECVCCVCTATLARSTVSVPEMMTVPGNVTVPSLSEYS